MDSLYNLAVIVSVVDRLTGPVKNMAKSFTDFENTVQKSKAMVDFGQRMAVSGALVQGAADKSVRALGGLLAPTIANQTALGELSSLGVKNLDALTLASQRFSAQWSGTTEAQFISAAYDIKSGIASLTDEGVAQFTTLAALTGKATKASTAEMTSLFATGYGIYKDLYAGMSDLQFGEMFSAGISSAVQQFKTTGTGMSQAMTTLGAAASTAQRPFEEQLAVLGMLQATMPGGEAGTKYKAFVQSAARAGQSLGLGFVDANGQLLGMVEIIEKLRGKYGDTLDAIEKQQIQKAFGTEEAVALVDLLYGKVGALGGNIQTLSGAMGQGASFTEGMARAMNDDLGASVTVLNQNVDTAKRFIGDELSPLIEAAVPVVQGWVTGFQQFTQTHPTLVRTALLIAAIATAALLVIAPILTVGAGLVMLGGYLSWSFAHMGRVMKWLGGQSYRTFSLLRLGFKELVPLVSRAGSAIFTFGRSAIPTASRALSPLIASVWSFTAALLANPITWIVLLVVGLGVAIWQLARNWDTVVAWVSAKMIAFKNLFVNGITAVSTFFATKKAEFLASGRGLIEAFVTGIKTIINKPAEVVKAGLQKVRELLPFSDAKVGPLSTLTYSGMALINTFAGGIQARAPYLQAVAASALGGVALPTAGSTWGVSPLSKAPALNMREVIRESSSERESVFTRDRRPIVVVVGGGQQSGSGYDQYIDAALRYLETQGN